MILRSGLTIILRLSGIRGAAWLSSGYVSSIFLKSSRRLASRVLLPIRILGGVKDDPVYGAGAQIDMLIERADNTVNICEMKFSQNEFVIDKDYDAVLRHKLSRFGASVSHRKAIHLTMVTTYGVVHNAYWNRVQSEVVADDLFL